MIEDLKRRIELKQQLIFITQDDIAVLRGLITQEEEKIKGAEAPSSATLPDPAAS
jgi:hypothetical protein